jgi:hypothetical protein
MPVLTRSKRLAQIQVLAVEILLALRLLAVLLDGRQIDRLQALDARLQLVQGLFPSFRGGAFRQIVQQRLRVLLGCGDGLGEAL